MTLRRKMGYQIGAMITGLLLVSAAALWGIVGLHSDYGSAVAGYQELRELYDASSHVSTARTLVTLSPHAQAPAASEINLALDQFGLRAAPVAASEGRKAQSRRAIRAGLMESLTLLKMSSASTATYDPAAQAQPLSRVLDEVSKLVADIRRNIESKQVAADRKRAVTILAMSGLSLLVIAMAIALGISEYRSVMGPLNHLAKGVRQIAEGHFDQRLAPVGHAEFVALANDFNRMAGELDELYRELERKVAQKSKELVRSERLASVGYLAAGVAHEINNPLGIIAGYAEFSLRRLQREASEANVAEAAKALSLICEEAFRCKQIIEKLLTLARPGDEGRKVISLGEAAANVVSIIGGLKQYGDRQLTLDAPLGGDLLVLASEGEMKQVILNLTLNALEATEGGAGRVAIQLKRAGDMVELAVEDNGRGMSREVLDRVFEPFFTAKRGAARPGTGLGLSITHAIVESHEGRIEAHSEGPGAGSRFVVQLPAAKGAVA